jgi:hypothetical protein
MRKHSLLLFLMAAAVPSTAFASVGLTLNGGAGLLKAGEMELKVAAEVSAFYELAIVRIEPAVVEMALKPARSFAWRPGVKVFVPLAGVYVRGAYGLGNLGGDGGLTQSVILGIGWQRALLNTVGLFFEATGEPQIKPSGGGFVALARAGVMLNL